MYTVENTRMTNRGLPYKTIINIFRIEYETRNIKNNGRK